MGKVDILLVEDRAEDAEMAMMALAQNQVSQDTQWVTNGVQALDFLRAEGAYKNRNPAILPKVILLDLQMPIMGGIETLQEIRGDKRLMHIPVVILTTSKEESDLLAAYDHHVNSYIVKPVEYDKFDAIIKELGLYWLLINQNS